jgi:hypothetical protein
MSSATPTPRSLARLPRRTWPVPVWEANRRWRACKRKTPYPTPQSAIDAALPRLRSAPLLRPYRCERCCQWHLTSQQQRSAQS